MVSGRGGAVDLCGGGGELIIGFIAHTTGVISYFGASRMKSSVLATPLTISFPS